MFAEGSYDQHLKIVGSVPFYWHENSARMYFREEEICNDSSFSHSQARSQVQFHDDKT
jgi:hypothetical protein